MAPLLIKHPSAAASKCALPRAALLAAALLLGPCVAPASGLPATALPTGGSVVAGDARISVGGASMEVTQLGARAVVNWDSFNVGRDAEVRFRQPGAGSVILNRVVGAEASEVHGRITANGQVFLVNSSGIYFSPTSRVDVGGLLATTASISDEDFMAGRHRFVESAGSGRVINEGELTAAAGGYVALLAPEVRNAGIIVAPAGTVALASGAAFSFAFDAERTAVSLLVEPSRVAALVENRRAILAREGAIILSAQGYSSLVSGIVSNSGTLDASGISKSGGRVLLTGDTVAHDGIVDVSSSAADGGSAILWADPAKPGTATSVSGSIDARGAGRGGFIETSAERFELAADASILAGAGGTWLIDPTDIVIGSTEAATYAASLNAGTAVSLLATNTITLSSSLSAGGAAALTLTAGNGIALDAGITRSGTGGVVLEAGAGGLTGAGNIALTGGSGLTVNQSGNTTYSGSTSGTGA
ncbi:MAG: filamentous hemagglutinin N-terminal domain-containing protein, partial [Opitutales bacterium]